MACERLPQLLESFAGSGREEPDAFALSCFRAGHQCGLPKFAAHDGGLLPGPSKSIRAESSYVLVLSSEPFGGRSERCQPAPLSSLFFWTQIIFCDSASVIRSCTNADCWLAVTAAEGGPSAGGVLT